MRWWLVFAGTRVTLERARTAREAKRCSYERFERGHGRLIPGAQLVARRATRSDVARYRAAEAQAKAGRSACQVA